jgi:hypothetical protein
VAGSPVAFVGDAVTVVGGPVAFVGPKVAFVGGGLGLVKGGAALRQVGLGGPEGLLGGLGAGFGFPDPDVVGGQGGQPPALRVLDDLVGQVGQLARARPSPGAELLERDLGVAALGGGEHALGLLDPDRLVSACRSWASSSSRLASSTLVWTSSPATTANSRIASSSCALQVRGWVL